MKKRTDAQLFKELRVMTTIIALVMIILFIAGFFIKNIDISWYKFILFIGGVLLLNYSFQKSLQENPKLRTILFVILIILALAGCIVLFMYN